MKILHVVENLNRGGLERTVIDLSKVQSINGHEVKILCITERGSLAYELDNSGISVTPIEKNIIGGIRSLFKIRSYVSNFHPDIIHTHNPIPNYLLVLSILFFRIPVVNTRHGLGLYWYSKKGKLFYILSQILTRSVVSVSKNASENFIKTRQIFKRKAIVINNGIDISKIRKRNHEDNIKLKNDLNIDNKSVLIGVVGRLNYTKNHDFLLESFSRVFIKNINIQLIIVGGGELEKELKCKAERLSIADKVNFLGARDDVYEILPAFDIYVLPSISEGFSISLLEACAAALPIVATNVGGNPEIICDGKNGLLVESKNIDQLSLAIETYLKQPEKSAEFGNNAYRWVSQNATLRVMYENYNCLYKSYLK